MKRTFTFALIILLLLSCTMPAAAAKIKAATMRLELIEGSATVCNSGGVAQSYTAGMRLYSGSTIETAKDSYAYISLDDSKAVKLDMLTTVRIKQSGKKLQVQLVSGQVFANVTTPLSSSETLEIRTSTMVTGIRGSSAVVRTFPLWEESSVWYLTGHGDVTFFTKEDAPTAQLTGGQGFVSTGTEGMVVDSSEMDYPAFVREEVRKNEDLQDDIRKEGRLSVPILLDELPALYEQEAGERAELDRVLNDVPAEPSPSSSPTPPPYYPPTAVYNVSLPTGTGYSIRRLSEDPDGGCRFTVTPAAGYENTEFTVSADGAPLSGTNGVYAVERLSGDVSITVEPKKLVLTEYPITYSLGGGEITGGANPEQYTVETPDFTLLAPTRAGYAFVGWQGTELGTAVPDVTVPMGSTGERSYTAVWAASGYLLSWALPDGALIRPLSGIPGAGFDLNTAEAATADGSALVDNGADFVFSVQSSFRSPLVYAGDALLTPCDEQALDRETVYVVSAVSADRSLSVKQGFSCVVELPEDSEFNADAPGSRQETMDGGVLLVVPEGGVVRFSAAGGVLPCLNGVYLTASEGMYSFTLTEDSTLTFPGCIVVDDGSLDTLIQAIADAAVSELTVLIDSDVTVPEGSSLRFAAPVILSEGRTLTLASDADITAGLINNGQIEIVSGSVMTVSEAAELQNNGSITADTPYGFTDAGNRYSLAEIPGTNTCQVVPSAS